MQVVDFTPDSDGILLVCDEDEEAVLQFYALYRRIKKVMPGVKRKLAAISFCDDTQVMAVQVGRPNRRNGSIGCFSAEGQKEASFSAAISSPDCSAEKG